MALGYKQKALETLYAVVANRRHRQWTKATEKMTLRFLDLCVELRKSDMAKEGLFQYRVTSIQVPNSLELVIKHFLQRARDAATFVPTFAFSLQLFREKRSTLLYLFPSSQNHTNTYNYVELIV